ncbi:drug/metabolite transporter (DMT)-like permease [Kibdelosporangium banguiense]|uniref:Drug/metabolite transporter (DMT)-like permease n=1 Tax=Kibdelosporangium banguiense TaxID=1365924 RepID=A0ABS4THP8_9PSEU|nr:DMT family transporter [Kibdelosporangium banguiense]MBP2323955.1 drug/metabolite transporter (DMT)-like permease [Kibdelosporangium banguiense]
MRVESNVIAPAGITLGALGVLAFSFSLPATRLAVADLDPWFVSFGRAVGAGLLAVAYLMFVRAPRPSLAQIRRLLVVALGIVVGFPLFTSLALTTQTSAHGAVVITCLPMCTAVWAVVRAGERPRSGFWLASGVGFLAVLVFVIANGGVSGGLELADVFLLIAVVLCGLGYAEGGALARDLGGARTVCWALVVSLPVTVPVTGFVAATRDFSHVSASAWSGFAYVTVISMFLGFFAWYAGLAAGGVAKVGQVQLAQPVLTLLWSVLVLGEPVGGLTVFAAAAVLTCVIWTQRART